MPDTIPGPWGVHEQSTPCSLILWSLPTISDFLVSWLMIISFIGAVTGHLGQGLPDWREKQQFLCGLALGLTLEVISKSPIESLSSVLPEIYKLNNTLY